VDAGQNIPIAAPEMVAIRARIAAATPGLASSALKTVAAAQDATTGTTDSTILIPIFSVYSVKGIDKEEPDAECHTYKEPHTGHKFHITLALSGEHRAVVGGATDQRRTPHLATVWI
jgi:hypothetical protein